KTPNEPCVDITPAGATASNDAIVASHDATKSDAKLKAAISSRPSKSTSQSSRPRSSGSGGYGVLHIERVPLNWNFEVLAEKFAFGGIELIGSKLTKDYYGQEIWISYEDQEGALKAIMDTVIQKIYLSVP
ncbi:MAG: hypothetical protein AAFU33_26780, partial [Bacteroidota bacterium]